MQIMHLQDQVVMEVQAAEVVRLEVVVVIKVLEDQVIHLLLVQPKEKMVDKEALVQVIQQELAAAVEQLRVDKQVNQMLVELVELEQQQVLMQPQLQEQVEVEVVFMDQLV